MSRKQVNRRSVLRMSGATLAALSGVSIAGNAAACPGCGDGEGLSVTTDFSSVSGDRVTTYGTLGSLGDASSADVWFEFGKEGEGLPNDTNLKTMDSTGSYCDGYDSSCWYDSYGSLDPGTYEYRAFAHNGYETDAGYVKTFTI